MARPLLIVPLSAVVGPATCSAAGQVWGVVTITGPVDRVLGVLGLCWFGSLLILSLAARHFSHTPYDALPVPLMRAP